MSCHITHPEPSSQTCRGPHPPLAGMMGGEDPRGQLKVSQARGGAQGQQELGISAEQTPARPRERCWESAAESLLGALGQPLHTRQREHPASAGPPLLAPGPCPLLCSSSPSDHAPRPVWLPEEQRLLRWRWARLQFPGEPLRGRHSPHSGGSQLPAELGEYGRGGEEQEDPSTFPTPLHCPRKGCVVPDMKGAGRSQVAFARCVRMTLGKSPPLPKPQGAYLQHGRGHAHPMRAGGMNDICKAGAGPRGGPDNGSKRSWRGPGPPGWLMRRTFHSHLNPQSQLRTPGSGWGGWVPRLCPPPGAGAAWPCEDGERKGDAVVH